MKKTIIGIIIGILLTCGIVYAAEILVSSLNVSYSSSYTEKTNVSDALDELFQNTKTTNLNGGEPIIKDNLIPVILSDNGEATYADTTKTWYDYGKKLWANSVELVAGVKYHKGQPDERDYQVGDKIPESDIRSYFVWIPKYRYKLWNVNKDGNSTGSLTGPHSIEIEFTQENTTDVEGVSCATPMTTNGSGNCDNGEWMTHPAFISMGVTGFWVGKFEIGNSLNTKNAVTTAMTSSTVPNIVVKPDYYTWTSTPSLTYFNLLKEYNSNLDSHMIKNTEWGAVAYLSHSKYGTDKEININNNIDKNSGNYSITGYSAKLEIDNHLSSSDGHSNDASYHTFWNTPNGYRASTTGNISGIYDMSGGAHEYVAGIRINVSVDGDSKYYDSYNSSQDNYADFKYRILGDAVGEIGPFVWYQDNGYSAKYHTWYGDWASFLTTASTWFIRGGTGVSGPAAGIFCTYSNLDTGQPHIGSRLVLSPSITHE